MSDLKAAQEAVREAARGAYHAARTPKASSTLREYYAAWDRLLSFYHPLPSGAHPEIGLPPDLAAMAQGLFRDFARGIIPETVSLVAKGSGARPLSAEEENDIRTALAYVNAATRIGDRSPVKSICERFGVKRTTVQGWIKNYEPSTFVDDDLMLESLDEAGERYRQAGRSHGAIGKRGAKGMPK